MACQHECITQYSCQPPDEPLDGAVFAPFVELSIKTGMITVGNDSLPDDPNKAVIKSFQYGFGIAGAGVGAEFEIVSEGQQAIIAIVRALNKTFSEAPQDAEATTVEFGWIIKKCSGEINKMKSETIHLLPKTMQTSYDNGTVKVKLQCQDIIGARTQETRVEGNPGSDDNKIPLKEAIDIIFERNSPTISVNWEGLGSEWVFEIGGAEGPKAKWPTDQQNALSAARKWLATQKTNNKKGLLMAYDPLNSQLVISEGKNSTCDENPDCCTRSIGTYVVNGGNCSDVLGFSPTVDWTLIQHSSGGTTGSDNSAANDEKANPDCPGKEDGGPATMGTVPSNFRDFTVGRSALRLAESSAAAEEESNKPYVIKGAIEAELVILGNPEFVNPIEYQGSTVSIVMLNPMYLEDCTWIANPRCNHVLSNKNWLIKGVAHQIEAGKFTTTLKVLLAVPNSDLQQGDPLGGQGCGTEAFDNDRGQFERYV